MTPTEFVTGLAEVMAVERTELATVDRALANHGLRRLARGRNRPDINLREGVQLVCAWAAAENLTLAADAVKRLEQFYPCVGDERDYKYATEEDTDFPKLFGKKEHQVAGIDFPTIVLMLARQLAAGKYSADKAWIAIEKGGAPAVEYKHEFAPRILRFVHRPPGLTFRPKGSSVPGQEINVKITASVRGSVLKWIHDVTEGA